SKQASNSITKAQKNSPHFYTKFSLTALSIFATLNTPALAEVSDKDFNELKAQFEQLQQQFQQLQAENKVKVGTGSEADGLAAIAVGQKANASGNQSTAIGANAEATASNAIAVGLGSKAEEVDTMAMGTNSRAISKNATAIGAYAESLNQYGVALGADAYAFGQRAIAIGMHTSTTEMKKFFDDPNHLRTVANYDSTIKTYITDPTVITSLTDAQQGEEHLAALIQDQQKLEQLIPNKEKREKFTTFAKNFAEARAILNNPEYQKNPELAHFGLLNPFGATGGQAIAVGNEALASGAYAVAMGAQTKASGMSSIAIGNKTEASGDQSFAGGPFAKATGKFSTALGNGANAMGKTAVAIGNGAKSHSLQSIAIGSGAQVNNSQNEDSTGSIAIGRHAESNAGLSIAIGADARNFTGGTYTAGTAVGTGAKTGGAGGVAIGNNAQANINNGNPSGGNYGIAVGTSSDARGQRSVALGLLAKATADYSLALGPYAIANIDSSIALGHSSVADRAAKVDGYNPLGAKPKDAKESTWRSSAGAVSVGNSELGITRQITNVAAGSEDTDAVNVAQLKQLKGKMDQDIEGLENKIGGINNQIGDINNQIGDINTKVDNINSKIGDIESSINNIDTSFNIQANGGKKTTINAGDTVKFVDGSGTKVSITDKNEIKVDVDLSSVDASSLKLNSGTNTIAYDEEGNQLVKIGDQYYSRTDVNDNGSLKDGAQAKTPIASTDPIKNAKTGLADLDKTAEGNLITAGDAKNLGFVLSTQDQKGNTTFANAVKSTDQVNFKAQAGTGIIVKGEIENGVNQITLGNDYVKVNAENGTAEAQAKGKESVAIGGNAKAKAEDAIALGHNAEIAEEAPKGSVALGKNAKAGAVHKGKHQIADATTKVAAIPDENTRVLAVGSKGNEAQIQHVAAGVVSEDSTDAINGSQLHATNVRVAQNSNNIQNLNNHIHKLDNKIDNVDKRARRGVAVAGAIGMLPQPRNAGGAMVSAATTNYRGEQALAVGFSKVSDNGKHIIKLSGASNASGKKDMMVGAAYGFEW
ncbi:hypothetical protein JP35_06120, partial [Gallibacterium anatis]|uniref:YadA-like family protein n=1 Tax=Gallibacterium anatis TaxID=750 RepID=UPI00053111C1